MVPGDSFSSGRPRIHTSFRSRGCRGAAVTLLPRHTAVFTRPVSATALTTRNDDHRIVGCRNGTEVAAEGRSSSPCNAEELWTGKAKRKPHPGARERPPVGIRLAFHSTLVSPQGQETPSVRGARRESCGMPEGSTGEDATATAQSSASRGHREEATRESSRLRSFSTSSANIAQATKRRERAESEHVEWKPSAFDGKSSAREHVSPPPPLQAYAYSIGGAFHNQRVASVRFLPGVEKCTARMGSKDDRQRTGMHLVTGKVAIVSLCLALGSYGDKMWMRCHVPRVLPEDKPWWIYVSSSPIVATRWLLTLFAIITIFHSVTHESIIVYYMTTRCRMLTFSLVGTSRFFLLQPARWRGWRCQAPRCIVLF